MKRLAYYLLGLALSVIMVSSACARPQDSTPSPTIGLPSKDVEKKEWDTVIAEAKKEGTAVIYTGMGPEERQALGPSFKQKYDIDLEFVVGRGTELVAKLSAQRQAGLYLGDVYIGGLGTHVRDLRPKGFLDPIKELLLLPEVLSPKGWYGERVPYFDKDQYYSISMILSPGEFVVRNTDMVKPGEIKSFPDLLAPKWKGQMVMGDPTRPGQPLTFVQTIGWLMPELGLDYLRQLAKQDLQIIADDRLQVEWVARGKHPLVLAPRAQNLATFMKAGSSLQGIEMAEGAAVSGGGGGLSIFRNRPHPNATKLFVNWLLTKEGQTAFSKGSLAQSARVDVPTDFLDQTTVRKTGIKYISADSEEVQIQQTEVAKIAQEIFGLKR